MLDNKTIKKHVFRILRKMSFKRNLMWYCFKYWELKKKKKKKIRGVRYEKAISLTNNKTRLQFTIS